MAVGVAPHDLSGVREERHRHREALDAPAGDGRPAIAADPVERAIGDLRAGRMVALLSGGEGHLVLAARFGTADAVNFLVTHARGLVCLALDAERCDRLGLEAMAKGAPPGRLPFTVSIEAREGVTTGISAADRARTIQVAIDPRSRARDLVQPGHVFPLRSEPGGVLERAGHAEAAVDLARLAVGDGAAVTCAVMDDDGNAAGARAMRDVCARHGLALVDVAAVVDWRMTRPEAVERLGARSLPTASGELLSVDYRSVPDGRHHLALVRGDVRGRDGVPVHVHAECLAGDVFGSLACDCALRLESARAEIERAGAGVVVYVARRRREVAAPGGCRADDGEREIGARIVADLGPRSVRAVDGR